MGVPYMRPLMLAECDTGKEPILQQASEQAAWRGGEGDRERGKTWATG